MPSLRYIFVSDQGRVFSSADEPTVEDFEYAAVGMMTIVRIANASYYGVEKQWRAIPMGRLMSATIEGVETPPFHAPVEFIQEASNVLTFPTPH